MTKIHRIGIIMNGVTGRMGTNQHLLRSIVPIIQQGGVKISDTEYIMPEPLLVGRNAAKLQQLAERTGIALAYTTDLDSALSDPKYSIYFDAQTTGRRAESIRKAVAAGKHIYCEKPIAADTATALSLYELCKNAGIKHGVVQDKLWLPGMLKLKRLMQQGFFGRILSVKGEFGYWVFEGHSIPAQRPSWNYRKEDEGGIILDMLCHWRYVLDHLFGKVKAVSCLGATHIPERIDEQGKAYKCTADDAAYATFELEGGVIAQFNSSWVTRVRRDDLLTIQVDGTHGSAVAGLRECYVQHYGHTPKPVWNPDIEQPVKFFDGWAKVPEQEVFENAFKVQWELFLKHIVTDTPFPWDLKEGAKGVQLAEKGMESWAKRCWVNIDPL
ncbi:gfo/Idh/MocA family oxidoreductase [Chitinophaga sp. SYP-B3965]|uniref:Gfo/Idh/MocA family protein n=1 Tax=Chitinophaga sp. SYP-B3965 TaxID=2663120 RepID=UPI0012995BC2|nr:Gfo/Idh/MocA family oxidoreductase [Chitinophaga sp. SYP-B3965]MRG44920.1 gfo/Idh/MocA family oxidoreductase [Chitinophaga sp. SYP-B3965]